MSATPFLAEWAVRSSMLVLAGALVLLVMRVKDSSVRLAAWVAMLFGSVLLPLLSVAVPAVRTPVVRQVVRPVQETVAVFYDFHGDGQPPHQAIASVQPFNWARALLLVYFVVALVLLLRVVIGIVVSRRLLRRTRATGERGIRESDSVLAPVTLGILRPVVVLPADCREWDEAKVAAVLAHERSHIGRFDPAVQLVSVLHRAVLWFSPASWFLHSRIVRVAEEASDDAAISVTRDRVSYAELLVEFMRCKECGAGVPMARYGLPEKRIYRILDGCSVSRGVTRWSATAIVMLGVPLAYLAASVRSDELPARAVAAVRESIPVGLPFVPQIISQVQAPPLPKPPAIPAVQMKVDERPKFDVASIRPCDPNYVPPGGRGGPAPTGRFRRNCVTVKSLINDAYIRFAGGDNRSPFATGLTKTEGGPGWLDSDQYTIEAEADEPATVAVKAGPMMQRLLEDRLQLRVHRESREGPIYELTAPKGIAKSLIAKGTPCVAADFADTTLPFFPGEDDRPCKLILNLRKGSNLMLRARGLNMQDLVQDLTGTTGRLVVDKTGVTETIDLDLIYGLETDATAAGVAPAAEDASGPSIFSVLDGIGLKLVPAKGSREYLVIDSVSRPSAN